MRLCCGFPENPRCCARLPSTPNAWRLVADMLFADAAPDFIWADDLFRKPVPTFLDQALPVIRPRLVPAPGDRDVGDFKTRDVERRGKTVFGPFGRGRSGDRAGRKP